MKAMQFNNEMETENIGQDHPLAVAMRMNAMARGVSWIDTYKITSRNLNM